MSVIVVVNDIYIYIVITDRVAKIRIKVYGMDTILCVIDQV